MSFEDYFNNEPKKEPEFKTPEKRPFTPQGGSIGELLSKIMDEISKDPRTEISGFNQFVEKYGDADEFPFNGFEELIEPYSEAMREALEDTLVNDGRRQHLPVLVGGAVDVAKELCMTQLKNAYNITPSDKSDEINDVIEQLDKMLDTDRIDTKFVQLLGLLQYVQISLAEVAIQSIIGKEFPDND